MKREQLDAILREIGLPGESVAVIDGWLARGDGVAVYRNEEFGHPSQGHRQLASYGSPEAQIETDEPPVRMPDIGQTVNWRYVLEGTYRTSRRPSVDLTSDQVQALTSLLATVWRNEPMRLAQEDGEAVKVTLARPTRVESWRIMGDGYTVELP